MCNKRERWIVRVEGGWKWLLIVCSDTWAHEELSLRVLLAECGSACSMVRCFVGVLFVICVEIRVMNTRGAI